MVPEVRRKLRLELQICEVRVTSIKTWVDWTRSSRENALKEIGRPKGSPGLRRTWERGSEEEEH